MQRHISSRVTNVLKVLREARGDFEHNYRTVREPQMAARAEIVAGFQDPPITLMFGPC
jgi:hypothetical protein